MKRLHDDHDSKACLLDTFRRAVANAGGGDSVAAHLGVTPSYISQILNGTSALGVRVILKSPDVVQKFLAEAWIEELGGAAVWPVKDKETAYKSIVVGLLKLSGWEPKAIKSLLPSAEDEKKAV